MNDYGFPDKILSRISHFRRPAVMETFAAALASQVPPYFHIKRTMNRTANRDFHFCVQSIRHLRVIVFVAMCFYGSTDKFFSRNGRMRTTAFFAFAAIQMIKGFDLKRPVVGTNNGHSVIEPGNLHQRVVVAVAMYFPSLLNKFFLGDGLAVAPFTAHTLVMIRRGNHNLTMALPADNRQRNVGPLIDSIGIIVLASMNGTGFLNKLVFCFFKIHSQYKKTARRAVQAIKSSLGAVSLTLTRLQSCISILILYI